MKPINRKIIIYLYQKQLYYYLFISKATILEYFNNLEHSRRVSGAGIYDMPDGKKVCSKSEFVLENCGKMPNIAN